MWTSFVSHGLGPMAGSGELENELSGFINAVKVLHSYEILVFFKTGPVPWN
jgi:hypothetical protein